MSEQPDPAAALAEALNLEAKKPTLADITTELLDDRDAALRRQNVAEAEVKSINGRLMQIMTVEDKGRHQHTDGSVIQVVTPGARETVVPELLLANGVDATIIRKCTRVSPVKSFIRVDRPAKTEADAAAQPAAEAPSSTATVQ